MTLRTRKQSHRLRTTIILTVIASVAAVAILYYFYQPRQVATTPTVQSAKAAISDKDAAAVKFGLPMRLTIPEITVDAPIAYMGLTASGEMDVPPDLITVGWYKFGTKPGEPGSAVIAGHLEGMEDLGVFTNLDKLKKGDVINVVNDRDETVVFAVRETRTYRQDERPDEVFNKTDGSYLNLITCSGTWDNAKKRYSHRYVVFADKITQ